MADLETADRRNYFSSTILFVGQQTYGHPHQMSNSWMPPHVVMEHGNTLTQNHIESTHNMYALEHQPIAQMYYDMDSSLAVGQPADSHIHVGEHRLAVGAQTQQVTNQPSSQPNSRPSHTLPSAHEMLGANQPQSTNSGRHIAL